MTFISISIGIFAAVFLAAASFAVHACDATPKQALAQGGPSFWTLTVTNLPCQPPHAKYTCDCEITPTGTNLKIKAVVVDGVKTTLPAPVVPPTRCSAMLTQDQLWQATKIVFNGNGVLAQ